MFLWLLHLDKQSSQNVCKMWQIGERGGGFCALVHPVFCNLLLLLSAKVLTSLYELGLTLLTRYQPFLLPLFLLLN